MHSQQHHLVSDSHRCNDSSAIAAIHTGFPDGSSVSDNNTLHHLIRGMFVERPLVRKLVSSWDLFQTLDTLLRAPFEPMGSASLFHLSIKVVFLMAIATARRHSELHSLTVVDGHIRWEPGGVRLIPRAGFLTKNQSSDFSPPDIVQAACWKSANTFSECYLKDVVQTEGRAGRTVLGAAAALSRRLRPDIRSLLCGRHYENGEYPFSIVFAQWF